MPVPDLAQIAADLESLEETIILRLIDRAQFHHNPTAYQPGQSGFKGEPELSLFALRLRYQEEMDAYFGRFCVPEERPFNRGLPASRRQVRLPPHCLRIGDFDRVNLCDRILESYMPLVEKICRPGDDGQYGSSVEHDVYAIQAIARRIHYGSLYVAESKYRSNPAAYLELLAQDDEAGLIRMLTRPQVEAQILARVTQKVASLQVSVDPKLRHVIEPRVVRDYYAAHIIPLTKQGEVRYLQHRRYSPDI